MDRIEVQAKISEVYENGGLIMACAWCARLCLEGEWLHVDRHGLSSIDAQLTLTHGICPGCVETVEVPAPAADRRPGPFATL